MLLLCWMFSHVLGGLPRDEMLGRKNFHDQKRDQILFFSPGVTECLVLQYPLSQVSCNGAWAAAANDLVHLCHGVVGNQRMHT